MIEMRMNRYFRRSTKMDKIKAYIDDCKLGDWFVLYQMSKNLNRPFFMDFLTMLSIRVSLKGDEVDTDSDTGTSLMKNYQIYLNIGGYVLSKIQLIIVALVCSLQGLI